MYRTNKTGFTLIEILIVMAILSVVALAVFSTFNSGIKIWQRLTKSAIAGDLDIFLEKISYDLRNSFKSSEIKFVGRSNNVDFATLALTEAGKKDRGLAVGGVGYYFDTETGVINRRQADYSQVYQNKYAQPRQVMGNVRSLNFQYYYYDPEGEVYAWTDTWGEEMQGVIPQAVRVNVAFTDGDEIRMITKAITIPSGG